MEKEESEEREWRTIIGIYKPKNGRNLQEVVDHIKDSIASVENEGQVKAVMAIPDKETWVALVCEWNGASDVNEFSQRMAKTEIEEDDAEKTSCFWPAKAVVTGLFKEVAKEIRGVKNCKKEMKMMTTLCVGDVIGIRRIYAEVGKQEMFMYSCVALLKSYFVETRGLKWCHMYRSRDGNMVFGISAWNSIEDAAAIVKKGSPGEAYWSDLGALSLKFHVCRVVYVSPNHHHSSSSSFVS